MSLSLEAKKEKMVSFWRKNLEMFLQNSQTPPMLG